MSEKEYTLGADGEVVGDDGERVGNVATGEREMVERLPNEQVFHEVQGPADEGDDGS